MSRIKTLAAVCGYVLIVTLMGANALEPLPGVDRGVCVVAFAALVTAGGYAIWRAVSGDV